MKIRALLFSALCLLALGAGFTSCDDNDDPDYDDTGSQVTLSRNRVFILNEGGWNQNNANISFYDPDHTVDFIKDIFQKQNNAKLGELGQDMIKYDDHIYVIVSGSQYITKLNAAGVEQCRFAFPAGEGQPRYLTAEDGYIYVTQYGGRVSKLDAGSLQRVKTFDGGSNLEGIAEENGLLYVANGYTVTESGYDYLDELLVIDANTMEQKSTIKVRRNPNKMMEANDRIFVLSSLVYQTPDGNLIQMIEPKANNTVTPIATATHMAAKGDILYLINSETVNSATGSTIVNTFFTYNMSTKQLSNTSFLKDVPDKLKSTTVYCLEINEENGDFYIGTTNYTSTGTIYRFKKDGTFVTNFDCGGINPNHLVFF